MWNGWAASNAAAPAYGLVSTANESGGSRRHHSHSSDWMPPIFGGKSFVTSRCFTSDAASSSTTSGSASPSGSSASSPSRRAAHTAWSRSIGSRGEVADQAATNVGVVRALPTLPSTTSALRRTQRGRDRRGTNARTAASTSSSSASSSSITSTHGSRLDTRAPVLRRRTAPLAGRPSGSRRSRRCGRRSRPASGDPSRRASAASTPGSGWRRSRRAR